ncbi:MAG TPA: 30S ribosome-binding factor RbfA [Burkholderiales bacterium]|nr:30S ribosome-binding factor RbfA [Burkholderiales bacterium]
MTKSFSRTTRIGDQIQKELSELIRLEVKDPRVGMVTITGVDVSSDYSHAKVFITTLDEKRSMEETLIGLGNAAGFLRKALFQRLSLRVIPQLHFLYDASIERGIHLTSLIDDAVASDKSNLDKG